jgi:hypothetical protein
MLCGQILHNPTAYTILSLIMLEGCVMMQGIGKGLKEMHQSLGEFPAP